MVKGVCFSRRNSKIGRTTIQAHADLWVNQNGGDINALHSRKVNVDVGGKLAQIDWVAVLAGHPNHDRLIALELPRIVHRFTRDAHEHARVVDAHSSRHRRGTKVFECRFSWLRAERNHAAPIVSGARLPLGFHEGTRALTCSQRNRRSYSSQRC